MRKFGKCPMTFTFIMGMDTWKKSMRTRLPIGCAKRDWTLDNSIRFKCRRRMFLFSALSALLSVQIVANRDDFRSAEFIPPERELRQHALDNSPTLFVDQPSCGLKSALLWLRLRRAVFFVV